MGWAQAGVVIAVVTGVIGLQSFWIARSLDALRTELHRSVDRLDGRLDRIEGQGPPTLRRV